MRKTIGIKFHSTVPSRKSTAKRRGDGIGLFFDRPAALPDHLRSPLYNRCITTRGLYKMVD